jgi:hypothetical protein
MSERKSPKRKPRWWTAYWLIIVVATVIIGVALPITRNVPVETAAFYLIVILIFEGLAYYARVKPSISLNRVMYILLGAPIGFVLWFISWFFVVRVMYPQAGENLAAVLISLIVCFGIAFVIGDLIGKARHYKGPEQYQP